MHTGYDVFKYKKATNRRLCTPKHAYQYRLTSVDFPYLFRIFPQSRQWAQPKQDPVDRKASRASSSSRLQSLETRLLFFSLKLDWQPPMHEVYLRSTMEHAQTSCGMWSNPIGPSTREHVYESITRLFVRGWGSVCRAPSQTRPHLQNARVGPCMEETGVGLVCGEEKA